MKPLFGVGLVVLILGVLSFFVPLPHSEHHGISAGDVHLGVTTEHSDPGALCPQYCRRCGGRGFDDSSADQELMILSPAKACPSRAGISVPAVFDIEHTQHC